MWKEGKKEEVWEVRERDIVKKREREVEDGKKEGKKIIITITTKLFSRLNEGRKGEEKERIRKDGRGTGEKEKEKKLHNRHKSPKKKNIKTTKQRHKT